MFGNIYSGDLESLSHEELLDIAKGYREKIKERDLRFIRTGQHFQAELRDCKKRAWAAKKELKALKVAALKKDETEGESEKCSSAEMIALRQENEELKRKNRTLRKANTGMQERFVKLMKVTRSSTPEDPVVREYVPAPPPVSNLSFKISKDQKTDDVVDELKKKIEALRKRKPGLFQNDQEYERTGSGVGRKKLNDADHAWDMKFTSVSQVSKMKKEKENEGMKEMGEYVGKYRSEEHVISSVRSDLGLTVSTKEDKFVCFIKYEDVKGVEKVEKGVYISFTFLMKDDSKNILYILSCELEKFKNDVLKRIEM